MARTGTIGRTRTRSRASTAVAPMQSRSAKAVEPSGRCASTSRTRPPTKAQTRPASRPIATVTTIPRTRTRCGCAVPNRRYGPTVSSNKAVTVAPTAASNRVIERVDPRRVGLRSRPPARSFGDGRTAATSRRSIPRTRRTSNGDRPPLVLARWSPDGQRRRVPVSRETRRCNRREIVPAARKFHVKRGPSSSSAPTNSVSRETRWEATRVVTAPLSVNTSHAAVREPPDTCEVSAALQTGRCRGTEVNGPAMVESLIMRPIRAGH